MNRCIHIYIYITSKSDFQILAASGCNKSKVRFYFRAHRRANNCQYLKIVVSFTKQVQNRATPNFFDWWTPNSLPRLFHTLDFKEMQRKSRKIKWITHLHLKLLGKSMRMDFGWCFRDPRPVLWMPDNPNKPPDASTHPPNVNKCAKRHWFCHRAASFRCGSGPGNSIIYWYIYICIFIWFTLHPRPAETNAWAAKFYAKPPVGPDLHCNGIRAIALFIRH